MCQHTCNILENFLNKFVQRVTAKSKEQTILQSYWVISLSFTRRLSIEYTFMDTRNGCKTRPSASENRCKLYPP